MNPAGPATRPPCTETALNALDRAYARHSGDSGAAWLPFGVRCAAADLAVVAAAGILLFLNFV